MAVFGLAGGTDLFWVKLSSAGLRSGKLGFSQSWMVPPAFWVSSPDGMWRWPHWLRENRSLVLWLEEVIAIENFQFSLSLASECCSIAWSSTPGEAGLLGLLVEGETVAGLMAEGGVCH